MTQSYMNSAVSSNKGNKWTLGYIFLSSYGFQGYGGTYTLTYLMLIQLTPKETTWMSEGSPVIGLSIMPTANMLSAD